MEEPSFRVIDNSGNEVGVWLVGALDDERFFERLQAEHGVITATVISGKDEGLEIWPRRLMAFPGRPQ